MKRKTQKEFLLELNDKNPEVYTNDIYVNATAKLTFHCKNNENHIWMADPHHILLGRGCPLCARQKAYETRLKNNTKRNDEKLLCNHNPELLSCIKNKKDAEKYTYASHKEIEWICPDCHETFFKRISYMTRRGFICSKCATNDSYPNKFMMEILRQLNIDYIREYSPEWIKPKRYDFYFIYDNQKYIIEMDGYFHNLESVNKTDNYKDKKAKEHEIKLIRIDCSYKGIENRQDYIVNNILNSNLNTLFDLSKIDFQLCDYKAQEKTYKKVCKMWDEGCSREQIEKTLLLSDTTVIKFLKFGEKHNICSYNHKTETKNNLKTAWEKAAIKNGQTVLCNETGEVFYSMAQASRTYHCAVGEYFRNNGSYAGVLPDGTKLTWKKLNKQILRTA